MSDDLRDEIARLNRVIEGDRQYIKRRVAERDAARAALDRVRAVCDEATRAQPDTGYPTVLVGAVIAAMDGPGE